MGYTMKDSYLEDLAKDILKDVEVIEEKVKHLFDEIGKREDELRLPVDNLEDITKSPAHLIEDEEEAMERTKEINEEDRIRMKSDVMEESYE